MRDFRFLKPFQSILFLLRAVWLTTLAPSTVKGLKSNATEEAALALNGGPYTGLKVFNVVET